MNLLTVTFGGTDLAYKAVLTKPSPTSTLSSGFQLEDGEGTSLPLWFGSDGVGVVNGAGFRVVLGTAATANRTVTFPDSSGTVSLDLYAILVADVTNSTTTGSAVSSFGVSLVASALYEFEIVLRAQSAATTTGLQFQITGPTGQISWVVYDVDFQSGTTLAFNGVYRQYKTALASDIAATLAPAANSDYLIRIRGTLKTTSTTPVGDIGITFKSSVAASQVTIKADSFMRFRKIN